MDLGEESNQLNIAAHHMCSSNNFHILPRSDRDLRLDLVEPWLDYALILVSEARNDAQLMQTTKMGKRNQLEGLAASLMPSTAEKMYQMDWSL